MGTKGRKLPQTTQAKVSKAEAESWSGDSDRREVDLGMWVTEDLTVALLGILGGDGHTVRSHVANVAGVHGATGGVKCQWHGLGSPGGGDMQHQSRDFSSKDLRGEV